MMQPIQMADDAPDAAYERTHALIARYNQSLRYFSRGTTRLWLPALLALALSCWLASGTIALALFATALFALLAVLQVRRRPDPRTLCVTQPVLAGFLDSFHGEPGLDAAALTQHGVLWQSLAKQYRDETLVLEAVGQVPSREP